MGEGEVGTRRIEAETEADGTRRRARGVDGDALAQPVLLSLTARRVISPLVEQDHDLGIGVLGLDGGPGGAEIECAALAGTGGGAQGGQGSGRHRYESVLEGSLQPRAPW